MKRHGWERLKLRWRQWAVEMILVSVVTADDRHPEVTETENVMRVNETGVDEKVEKRKTVH